MEINIAYWANENFSKHTYISLLSLLLNLEKSNTVNCFFFTVKNNCRSKSIKKLEKIFRNFKYNEIICDELEIKTLKTSKQNKHLNHHTYYRFFIEKLEKVDKILYMDSDTIIVNDIVWLFNEIITDKIVWVVSDCPSLFVKKLIDDYDIKNNKYFNSGVMLVDLKKWKKNNISEKCLNLLKENSYPCNDQDPLNIILENSSKRLDWKYNVQSWFFDINDSNFVYIGFDKNYYYDAIKTPVVVHFAWSCKPWQLTDNHPFRTKYDYIKLLSFIYGLRWGEFLLPFWDFLIILVHFIERIIIPSYKLRENIRIFVRKFLRRINLLK